MRQSGLLNEFRNTIQFGLLAGLIFCAAVGLEFRYNYVEKAIGRYLFWHNASRQESGQIWETVSLSENVQQRLDDLVRNKRQETTLIESITSLDQLVEQVHAREKIVMTRDRFLEMYADLPLYQSSLLIEPVDLIELIGQLANWQRTLIAFEEGNLSFYLVDGLNNVLKELSLSSEYINFFLSEKETRALGLDAFPWLREKFYPADVFYDAFSLLTPEERGGIPLSALNLISWRYRLQQVAVNHQSLIGERMEIGFELSGDEGLYTVRILGRSLSVLSLTDKMDSLLVKRGTLESVPVGASPAESGSPGGSQMPVTP
ncbi:MAG TPA: hypothetical protein VM123_02775 [archaeon]|nr:hypothetical protein [archaeon]